MYEVRQGYSKLIVFLTVLLVCIGVYVVLYANIVANNSRFVMIRNGYVNTVERVMNVLGLPEVDYYVYLRSPIRVLSKVVGRDEYYYSLRGKVEKVDRMRGIIYLRCSDGNLYGFTVEKVENQDPDWLEMFAVQFEGTKTVPVKFIFNVENVAMSGEKDKFFDSSQIYTVVWGDRRLLVDILSAYRHNVVEPINLSMEQIYHVSRR